ncbi:MAG: tyrosine-type recombinase/integrase [Planctomycetes bacterium]|nr:tyrosine-type recombinase/integrase [Planctomycetota bacterium]
MPKGPPTECARDNRGHVVNGLRVQKAKDKRGRSVERFYAITKDGQRRYFGNSKNRREAIRKYRKWQAEVGRETIAIGKRIADLEEFVRDVPKGEEFTITVHSDGTVSDESDVAADAFWEKVAEQIRENPKLAAQKTGIEELAYLDRLKPVAPSATLDAIISLYVEDKRSVITHDELRNSQTWWTEFAAITKAKRVSDLDRAAFREYRNVILNEVKKQKLSNAWARSRFGKIKTVINYALSESDLTTDDRAALVLRSLLKQPSKPPPNPIDITPTELRKILAKADAWETALVLVALNCAYYPVDCQRLCWDMVDFRRGTIRFDREKATGRAKGSVPRVAALWKRTLTALKRVPHEGEHIFLSEYKRPVHKETIRRHWIKLRNRARVERPVTFANLRDSALTAAAESTDPVVPVQQYHVLAGHVAKGVDDAYITRNPRFVQTACEAIEKRYFPHRRRR